MRKTRVNHLVFIWINFDDKSKNIFVGCTFYNKACLQKPWLLQITIISFVQYSVRRKFLPLPTYIVDIPTDSECTYSYQHEGCTIKSSTTNSKASN